MIHFKWQQLFLFLLSTLFLPSHEASHHAPKTQVQGAKDIFSDGASQFHNPSTKRFLGAINDNVLSWKLRSLFEAMNQSSAPRGPPVVLAEDRTHRKDPTQSFEYYTGGWNVSDKHYLWSVGFSAAGPFIVSAIWLFGFGTFLLVACILHFCYHRKCTGYPQIAYIVFLAILVFVTIDTIIGSGVLLKGQDMFHKNTRSALSYILDQANNTSEKLKIVQTQLSSAKQVAVDQKLTLPPDITDNVDKVLTDINSSVIMIDEKKDEIPGHIKHVLDQVILSLIIISSFMLFFTVLGLVLAYVGMELPIYILVVMGWIFVAGLFVMCGIFLLFHNAVGDTCLAMDEWVQNPTAHTALDDLLSCPDNATSQRALNTARNVTVQLLGNVNQFVALAGNANFPSSQQPKGGSFNYNQSGPLMPLVCVPYNTDLTDRNCANGEVDVANASQLYGTFLCDATSDDICTSKGRLTPKIYGQLSLATNVSYTLHHYGPFLVELMDCSFVRETFSLISKDHCPGLSRYSYWIYIGLSMVASGVMLSVMIWAPYAQRIGISSEYAAGTAL